MSEKIIIPEILQTTCIGYGYGEPDLKDLLENKSK